MRKTFARRTRFSTKRVLLAANGAAISKKKAPAIKPGHRLKVASQAQLSVRDIGDQGKETVSTSPASILAGFPSGGSNVSPSHVNATS
jgi:hypothetical protein